MQSDSTPDDQGNVFHDEAPTNVPDIVGGVLQTNPTQDSIFLQMTYVLSTDLHLRSHALLRWQGVVGTILT